MECMKQRKMSLNDPLPFCTFMQKQGNHVKNKGVFIALEICKMSLCPSSHDHAKFSHDYVKLIRIIVKILTLCTISHDYAKSSLSTAAKWTLWTTSHTYAKISHVCAKNFFKKKKKKKNKFVSNISPVLFRTVKWKWVIMRKLFVFVGHEKLRRNTISHFPISSTLSLIFLPCLKPQSNIGNLIIFSFWFSKIYLSTHVISSISGIWISFISFWNCKTNLSWKV